MSGKAVRIVVHFDNEHKAPKHLLMPAESTLEDVISYVRTVLGDKVLHVTVIPEVSE